MDKMMTIVLWFITFMFYMVVFPIVVLIQALYTPIEIIISCIRAKCIIRPEDYWKAWGQTFKRVAGFCESMGEGV